MKRTFHLPLLLLASLFLSVDAFAQTATWTSCSSTSGNLDDSTTVLIPGDTVAPIPSSAFTTMPSPTSDIPQTDFFVILQDSMAADSLGDAIIAASVDGSFNPANHGLMAGDTFHIATISYNIWQLRRVLQSILHDGNVFFTCCTVLDNAAPVPGICDSLNAAGIYDSTDINNADDLLTFLSIFSGGGSASLRGVKEVLLGINDNIAALNTAGCSGGETEVCYAMDSISTNHRHYIMTNPTNVSTINNLEKLTIAPNPASNYVNINMELNESAFVALDVYSMTGQRVLSKTYGTVESQQVELNTNTLTNGVYMFRFTVGDEISTHKIVVNHR